MDEGESGSVTGRREPPAFRRLEVVQSRYLGPRMIRVTFTGPELDGLVLAEPAASVRLLLPTPGTTELVMPAWNGNEFLLHDGSRPTIRTFTPRRVDPGMPELDLDMVVHAGGVASSWAVATVPGAAAAVSGPGRGYTSGRDAHRYFLAGDETAIPAMSQLLESLPHDCSIQVHIEIVDESGMVPVPDHPGARVSWHRLDGSGPPGTTLETAVRAAQLGAGTQVWSAGEAAAMHRIRTHLFKERGLPRSHATVRGYWKIDRNGP